MRDKVYIGDLKDRISVLEEVQTVSSTGSAVSTMKVLKSCWANQITMRTSEDEDGKIRALFSDAFIIRYDAALIKGRASEMIIVDVDGFVYNIVSVEPKIAKRYLQINTVRRE